MWKDDPAPGGCGASVANLGTLPEWNLRDLYSSPDGADFARDFASAEQRIAIFESHRGKVASLDSAAFGAAIAEFEAISEILGKIGSYANSISPAMYRTMSAGAFTRTRLNG